MLFAQKLRTLMDIYRINNIVLARGIGVDPSLVSRWKSGERIPSRSSAVVKDISFFLAGQGMLGHDRDLLNNTVNCAATSTREETSTAIERWLNDMETVAARDLTFEEPAALLSIMEQVRKVFSVKGARPPDVPPLNLWSRIQAGQPMEHETFRGRSGKRLATISFLHAATTAKTPTEIFLMYQDDPIWLLEDVEFNELWRNSLLRLAQQGHRIHMLHSLPPDDEVLGEVLKSYMPLYMTGRFSSHYNPEHRVDTTRPTLFVTRGLAAVVSHCGPGQKSAEYTLLFKREADINLFWQMSQNYLNHGRSLAEAVPAGDVTGFAETLIQMEEKSGRMFSVRNTPDALWLPETVLSGILFQGLPAAETARCLALLSRRRGAMEARLPSDEWVEIMPVSFLDAIALNGACRMSGLDLFGLPDVTLGEEQIAQMLQEMLRRLEQYPNLSILFTNDCPADMNILFKENHGSYFTATVGGGNPAAVYIGETGLLSALERWFLGLRQNAVGKNGRADGIEMLKEALEMLENI